MTKVHDAGRVFAGTAMPATVIALLLAGCAATAPRPQLANAQQAIAHSTESGGHEYAPLEMRLARERFEKAQEAMNDGDYTEARRLAEKATVDAQLAEAKAEAAKAEKQAGSLQRGVENVSGSRPVEGTSSAAEGVGR